MNKKIKLLITDWSGVISDDRPLAYESNMRVIDRFGIPRFSYKEWMASSEMGPRQFFERVGIKDDMNKLYDEYTSNLMDLRSEGVHPAVYDDAVKFLGEVKSSGKDIFVISAHPISQLQNEAREYKVDSLISKFVGSVNEKVIEIQEILKETRENPSQVMYLGDTIYDIQSAKKAGVISAAVTTGYHAKDKLLAEKPDILADSLTELLNII